MTNLEFIKTMMLVVFMFIIGCMTVEEDKEEHRKAEQRKAEWMKIRN